MVGSENSVDLVFQDGSFFVAPSSDHSTCSQFPQFEWGSSCNGEHAFSIPSYMTLEWNKYPMPTEDQEVDQILKIEAERSDDLGVGVEYEEIGVGDDDLGLGGGDLEQGGDDLEDGGRDLGQRDHPGYGEVGLGDDELGYVSNSLESSNDEDDTLCDDNGC